MRPTRAAVLPLDEERDDDFMKLMSEALKARRSNPVVRLEIAAPADMTAFVRERLDLGAAEVYEYADWLDLKGISQFAFQAGFQPLKRPAWEPRPAAEFERADDVFKLLREKDVLVHHPYESFDCVARFLRQAAEDPDVLAIKQTLYRAGRQSSIISSLEAAAEAGKRVTVLVELKARFDEENNIEWAKRLEAAGASVIYGVAGPQDPRQGGPGGAPRAGRHPALRASGHRELQREDRAPLLRPGPVHLQGGLRLGRRPLSSTW